MTELRISVRNSSDFGGTFLTPVYFGFHDGSFDLFEIGQTASAGLEALAEDGNASILAAERVAADNDSQGVTVTGGARSPDGAPPLLATGELTSAVLTVDGASNGSVTFASMVVPSNDAFIGNEEAVTLFDDTGTFQGAYTAVVEGTDVYDAGTEVNTEMDAAFINQTGPNTGETEGGTVQLHPGFNGSLGNPGGDQIILGGNNAFGEFIDPEEADFTLPGAQIAVIHINEITRTEGTSRRDFIRGDETDDLVNAGAGRDIVWGKDGWDEISGGSGRDLIFGGNGFDILNGDEGNDKIFGGNGSDVINGGTGRDWLAGGSDNDAISGGDDRDVIFGGRGDDEISGGAGRDFAYGGSGADTFLFTAGDGFDRLLDFKAYEDGLRFTGTNLASLDDLAANAWEIGSRLFIKYTESDLLILSNTDLDDLTEGNVDFV